VHHQVEAYRTKGGLTQYFNCQKFGHVFWANCRQPHRCMWCRGGHLHKDFPEKKNEHSTPRCCNYTLTKGENPQPSNYCDCSHAKEEPPRRRVERASVKKTPTGRVFFSRYVTLELRSSSSPSWEQRKE